MKNLSKLLFVVLVLTACNKQLPEPTNSENQTNASNNVTIGMAMADGNGGGYVADEVLIKFKAGVTESGRLKALNAILGTVKEHILTNAMISSGDKEGLYLIKTKMKALDAINASAGNTLIEYAELNQILVHQQTTISTSDPYLINGALWGMQGGFGTNANIAWGKSTGKSTIYVGVIDEGIMYNHEDLATNIWTNTDDPENGIDEDKNGLIDDVHGWDFANNDKTIYDGSSSNKIDAHGTHVSGTIGAISNNAKGVVGMNWNIKIISAKFLGSSGGSIANAIKAVDYITNLKKTKNLNIIATNNSWGGGSYSQALFDAIERANNQGILFIAAAGNGNAAGFGINLDSKPSYPASYKNTNVIAVAAIDVKGNLAPWSNYGLKTVSLGAPGVNIISSVPYSTTYGLYEYYNGTSMATPHVTGAVALYASTFMFTAGNAKNDAQTIKSAIISKTSSTPSLSGKTITGGRLNVGGF